MTMSTEEYDRALSFGLPRNRTEREIMRPLIRSAAAEAPRVETYDLIAANGRPIRKATRVVMPDGRVISFAERLSRREALRQAAQIAEEV